MPKRTPHAREKRIHAAGRLAAGLALIAALWLGSCGAHAPRTLDARYQTIHIQAVRNDTLEFGLEEPLTHALIDAFRRNHGLRVTREPEADIVLTARVTDALFAPTTFSDLDRAVGYRVRMVVVADAVDASSGEYLLENRPFQAEGDFILGTSPTAATSRDVSAAIAESIYSALVEGW